MSIISNLAIQKLEEFLSRSHFNKELILSVQTYGIDSIQVFVVAYNDNYKNFEFRREKYTELIDNWPSNICNIKGVFRKNDLKTYKLY